MHDLMMHDTPSPSRSMRVQAVIDHPHIADWFFTVKLSEFVEQWLYKALDAEWHWYRFEYQARGSTHAHGCAKQINYVPLCKRQVQLGCYNRTFSKPVQQPLLSRKICYNVGKMPLSLYYSMLIGWLQQLIHLSLMNFGPFLNHIPVLSHSKTLTVIYHDLLNSVQRHTRCSAAYCLRKKANNDEPQCRFNYPFPEQTTSYLEFEKRTSGSIRATLNKDK